MDVTAKVAAFFSKTPVHSYNKGAVILRPGDPILDIYYVQSGFLRLYCLLGNGKELTLNIFKPHSYFPMFLVFSAAETSHYIQAMTTVKLSKVPKEAMLRFLKHEPDVLLDFTARLSIGLHGLITNIQHSLFGPVHTRIISALLLLAKRFGQPLPDGSVNIAIRLTHQDIANIIGTARETVSIEMKKLAQKHLLVDKQCRITIKNTRYLKEEALLDDGTTLEWQAF